MDIRSYEKSRMPEVPGGIRKQSLRTHEFAAKAYSCVSGAPVK